MPKEKVVLAFSGGLDTSFCVLYLREKGYDVITLTIDTGGLTEKEIKSIAARSKELGAIKHCFVNAQREAFDEIIADTIKTNGLYQGVYPNMCADRYIIGKHLIAVAKKEGAKVVVHGSTGAGNDQARFDVTISCLAPELKIIAPIRELGITRPKEIEYLEKQGFKVPKAVRRYTINENVWGRTMSGSEIDENKEPEEGVWVLTKPIKKQPEYVEIRFEKGVPVALNGKKLHGIEILKKLNIIAGAHGYGRGLYFEDETIGIKGIQAFEAPGLLLLIEAHRALERAVMTRRQQITKLPLESLWADLAYRGMLYEPVMGDIKAFVDSGQQFVTGTVRMKLDNKNVFPVGVYSPFVLVRKDIAEYAQRASWTGKEAEGFIKLFSLQQKIAHVVASEQARLKRKKFRGRKV